MGQTLAKVILEGPSISSKVFKLTDFKHNKSFEKLEQNKTQVFKTGKNLKTSKIHCVKISFQLAV